MPYFHSTTFSLNVPPNFIVSTLMFAFVSDTEDGTKKLFTDNVFPSTSFTCCITKVWSSNDTKLDSMVPSPQTDNDVSAGDLPSYQQEFDLYRPTHRDGVRCLTTFRQFLLLS